MTLADLIAQTDAKLAIAHPHRTTVTCYDCGQLFVCYKMPDTITETEVCGSDSCMADSFREEPDYD